MLFVDFAISEQKYNGIKFYGKNKVRKPSLILRHHSLKSGAEEKPRTAF
jgi:hypothetical protein